MKYKSKYEKMNLPPYIKFGCEIEAQNCDFKAIKQAIAENPNLKGWKVIIDESVTDNGIEVVSPPLSEQDKPNIYEQFDKVLKIIKSNPADKTRSVYVDENCGGHIHFDATMMKKNPEMIESFLHLWREAEPLIYKMCNAENDVIRKSAVKLSPVDGLRRILFSVYSEIYKATDVSQKEQSSVLKKLPGAIHQGVKKSIKGVLRTAVSLSNPKGFAHPVGKKIALEGKKGSYIKAVDSGSKGTTIKFGKKLKDLTHHQAGINLQHLSKRTLIQRANDVLKKRKPLNTYELRLHNGSLNLETWKQNIYFDAALAKIAYEMAYEPGKNDHKLSAFFDKGLSEEEKADKFLNLMFDSEEDRAIYKSRWASVKDDPVYAKAKGFDKSCFNEEYIKKIVFKMTREELGEYMKRYKEMFMEFMRDENSGFKPDGSVMDYGGRD